MAALRLKEMLKNQGSLPRVPVIGIPLDENSSYKRGAAKGPKLIGERLLGGGGNPWSETGEDLLEDGAFAYLGLLEKGSDGWFEAIGQVADLLYTSGKNPIFLGGDHSITFPLVKALAGSVQGLTILHIDAHPDLYDNFESNPHSHASPMARIMEGGLAKRLIQIGVRTLTADLRRQISRFGVECYEMGKPDRLPDLQLEGPVYLSIDMDGLDPAFAPGVSHREPGGLTTREVLDLIHACAGHLVAADVVEYNPRFDISYLTADVAAKLVRELAGVMLKGLDH